jgi:hypothetical protein
VSRSERDKGASGAREVAAIFRGAGFNCERTSDGTEQLVSGDLHGVPGVYVDAKRHEALRLPAWTRDAREKCPLGSIPVVAYRRNREPWYAVLPLTDLVELLSERWL